MMILALVHFATAAGVCVKATEVNAAETARQ